MKKGKKKKKEKPPYNYKYPQLNYEELKKVPLFNFTAKNGSLKNSNDDIVTGSIPMDYSFNKIKINQLKLLLKWDAQKVQIQNKEQHWRR